MYLFLKFIFFFNIELDRGLHAIFGDHVDLPSLPKKTFWKRVDDAFIKIRQFYLQKYLNAIQTKLYLCHSKIYRDFLKMDQFFKNSVPIKPFLRFVQNVLSVLFCLSLRHYEKFVKVDIFLFLKMNIEIAMQNEIS